MHKYLSFLNAPPLPKDTSNKNLIHLVQKEAFKLGRVPKEKEFTYHGLAIQKFGSWEEFLNKAGMGDNRLPVPKVKMNNGQLIQAIQEQAEILGRTPKKSEFQYGSLATARYGSWMNFILAAGLKPLNSGILLTNEELIKLVQDHAAELGRTPFSKEFEHSRLAANRFGNWLKFLASAGLKPSRKKMSLSDEVLINSVRELAAELGRTPRSSEFSRYSVAISHFGTWKNFVERAGLEYSEYPKKISDEELIASVRKRAAELGRTPRSTEFDRHTVAGSRFGTWKNFIERAGLEPLGPLKKISDEELIASVRKRATELGRTPKSAEFDRRHLAPVHFGSWNNFIKRAGLKPLEHPNKKSNEELIDLVKKRAAELGRTPKSNEFQRYYAASKQFGSWKNFLKAAGLEPFKQVKEISDEELFERVHAQAAELGRPPKLTEFQGVSVAIKRFGKWNNFLKAAGLETYKPVKKILFSNENLFEQVQTLAAELGRTPKTKEFKRYATAVSRFGTWESFIKAAGLEPSKPTKEISDESLFEQIRALAVELYRIPKAREFKRYSTAVQHFGTWKNFIKAAGLESFEPEKLISDENLFEQVQTLTAELGRIPKTTEFKLSAIAIQRFGNWEKFLQKTGLLPDAAKVSKPSATLISDSKLLSLIKVQAAALGRNPQVEEFEYAGKAIYRYGSWEMFLFEAGLTELTNHEQLS